MDGRALASMLSAFRLRLDAWLDRNHWICSDKIWDFCFHFGFILSSNWSFTYITGLTSILVLSSCFKNEGTSSRILRNLCESQRRRAWSIKFKTKTIRVRLSDSWIGTQELTSFIRDGWNIVNSGAICLAIFERCCDHWTQYFSLTFLNRLTPAVVLLSKYGKLSIGGSSVSRNCKGSASFTWTLFAGIPSQLARLARIFIIRLKVCNRIRWS